MAITAAMLTASLLLMQEQHEGISHALKRSAVEHWTENHTVSAAVAATSFFPPPFSYFFLLLSVCESLLLSDYVVLTIVKKSASLLCNLTVLFNRVFTAELNVAALTHEEHVRSVCPVSSQAGLPSLGECDSPTVWGRGIFFFTWRIVTSLDLRRQFFILEIFAHGVSLSEVTANSSGLSHTRLRGCSIDSRSLVLRKEKV